MEMPWPQIRGFFEGISIVAVGSYTMSKIGYLYSPNGRRMGVPIERLALWQAGMLLFSAIIVLIEEELEKRYRKRQRPDEGPSKDPRDYRGGSSSDSVLVIELMGGKSSDASTKYSATVPEEYREVLRTAMKKLGEVLEKLEMEDASIHSKGITRGRRRRNEENTREPLIVGGKSTRRRRRI